MRSLDYAEVISKLVSFIQEKVEESNVKGVILGISGGVDSATVAYLATKAIGKEKVLGLVMPYYMNKDVEDALLVCNNLGINYKVINIKSIVNEFEKNLGFELNNVSKGNIMARIRMILLYAHANSKNYLVLGTSNRSEFLTGYFTKWGDSASDYAPLINLYKTEVWNIARILRVPNEIINKKPSAGLWEGQTDEKDLGITYKLLDEILYRLVDLKMKKENIARDLNIPLKKVEYVESLIKKSEHKRKLPLGPEI